MHYIYHIYTLYIIYFIYNVYVCIHVYYYVYLYPIGFVSPENLDYYESWKDLRFVTEDTFF